MKRIFASLAFLFALTAGVKAQAIGKTTLPPLPLAAGEPLHISFTEPNRIDNLLVIVSDSTGRTIFLDNKYRFEGAYKHQLDLSRSGKGKYLLSIIKDREQTVRDIIVN